MADTRRSARAVAPTIFLINFPGFLLPRREKSCKFFRRNTGQRVPRLRANDEQHVPQQSRDQARRKVRRFKPAKRGLRWQASQTVPSPAAQPSQRPGAPRRISSRRRSSTLTSRSTTSCRWWMPCPRWRSARATSHAQPTSSRRWCAMMTAWCSSRLQAR